MLFYQSMTGLSLAGTNTEQGEIKRAYEDSRKPLVSLGGRSRDRTADLFRVNDKGR
jgi:hypothetical protein